MIKLEKYGYFSHHYRTRQLTFLVVNNGLMCPLCREKREKWHVSHLIQKMDGGKNNKYNLTIICALCHRTIHDGEGEQSSNIFLRLNMFMLSQHGIIGRKELLKAVLNEAGAELSLKTVREIHQEAKNIGMNKYLASFAPNTAFTGRGLTLAESVYHQLELFTAARPLPLTQTVSTKYKNAPVISRGREER